MLQDYTVLGCDLGIGVDILDCFQGLSHHSMHLVNMTRFFIVFEGQSDARFYLSDLRLELAQLRLDLNERDGLLFDLPLDFAEETPMVTFRGRS